MKKIILLMAFATLGFASNIEVETIDAHELKEMIDTHQPFVLLDARGDSWNDRNIIPGAKLAGSDFSDERLAALIPDKSSLIVVYGFTEACPKRRMLIDKLHSLGYYNLMEYLDGLKLWRDVNGYPVDEIQK